MLESSVRVGRLAGIPIGVHPLWLVVVALFKRMLGADYYPAEVHGIAPVAAYALGLLSVLLLFASILLHELGHALVARRDGMEIEEIDLWLLGGVARMRGSSHGSGAELRMALAGPAVTLVVAVAFGVAALSGVLDAVPALAAVVAYQAIVNAVILGFNLLPAFPLDGGRVTHAILWWRLGDRTRATVVAAAIGRGFGYLFIAFGALNVLSGAIGGLWLMLVGLFILSAGTAEVWSARVADRLRGVTFAQLMSHPPVCLPAHETVVEAVRAPFANGRFGAFPVVDATGRAIGLVSLAALRRAAVRRPAATVADTADRDPGYLVPGERPALELLESSAFQRSRHVVVVDAGGRPVGVLSITDIDRAARTPPPPAGISPRPTLPGAGPAPSR